MTNIAAEELRTRLQKYLDENPINKTALAKIIGYGDNNRYIIGQFMNGKMSFSDERRELLNEYLFYLTIANLR